jgi:hypothetical protein
MAPIGVWDQQERKHEEKQDVAEDEVGSEHAQLSDLAEEFTTRLRNRVPSHCIPFSGPPGNVGGISLELTSEGKSDDELEEESLDGDNSDHTRQRPREAEAFKEHEDNKEDEEYKDGNGMSDSGEYSSKLLAAHAE